MDLTQRFILFFFSSPLLINWDISHPPPEASQNAASDVFFFCLHLKEPQPTEDSFLNRLRVT